MSSRDNPQMMYQLTGVRMIIVLLLGCVCPPSAGLHIYYSDDPDVASSKAKLLGESNPSFLTSSSFSLKPPVTHEQLLPSSRQPTLLNDLVDMGVSFVRKPKSRKYKIHSYFHLPDTEVNNGGLYEEYKSRNDPLNFAIKSELSLAKMTNIKNKAKEIIKALRRRHKKEMASAKDKGHLTDMPFTKMTIPEIENIAELENKRKEKMIKTRPAKIDIPINYRLHIDNVAPDKDSGFSSFGNTDKSLELPAGTHRFMDQNQSSKDLSQLASFDDSKVKLPVIQWFSGSESLGPRLSASPDEIFPKSSRYGYPGDDVGDVFNPIEESGFSGFLQYPDFSEGFMDIPVSNSKSQVVVEDHQQSAPGAFSEAFDEPKLAGQLQQRKDTQAPSQWGDGSFEHAPSQWADGSFEHAPSQWADGSFEQDDKDCETISTNSCLSDEDCSCHGFYECSQERCQLLSSGSQHTETGTWYDQPFDFGLDEQQDEDNDVLSDETKPSVTF